MLYQTVCLVIMGAALVASQGLGECDPLVPQLCGLPMPNDFWRTVSSSGKAQLRFTPKAFPTDGQGKGVDPQAGGWNDMDGFSPSMPMITYLGDGVDIASAPHHSNIERSVEPNCPTIVLDVSTGKIVPHWVELDMNGPNPQVEQALFIWAAKRLDDSRRYIVAVRNLTKVGGAPIQPSVAFKALRDNINTTDPDVELRRDHFRDIFERLEHAGVSRSSLLQAWDFTTASREAITGRLVFMRDDAFKRVAGAGIQYRILSFQDNVSDNIARRVEVEMQVPRYVDSPLPGAKMVIGPDGKPVFQGMTPIAFTINIPRSLVDQGKQGDILQYGHGLFGSRSEGNGGYLAEQAQRNGWVLIASDWDGLATLDAPIIYLMMAADLTDFKILPDRCQQGVLQALFAMRLLREGRLAKDPAMMPAGKPVLSTSSQSYYTGNSQGGILGTVYMAVSTDVKRGVLGVPGGPYSLLLPRSVDADRFGELLLKRFPDNLNRARVYALLQILWDRADPGGYMGSVTSNPLPGNSEHEVILQHALGDAQVSNLGAYAIGRSVGAFVFESNVHYPGHSFYGFPVVRDSDTGSRAALVSWEYEGVPQAPDGNVPPLKEWDTHGRPRKERASQDQMLKFFQTGVIENSCRGPCRGKF